MNDTLLSLDTAKQRLAATLDQWCPGTYDEGFAMAQFLRDRADAIGQNISDRMSEPEPD